MEDLELIPIRSALEAPVVVHGTNKKAWQLIKDQVCMSVSVLLVEVGPVLANGRHDP